MESKLLQLALNNLIDEVEKMKFKISTLEKEVAALSKLDTMSQPISKPEQDELMDIKEVQRTLGICYNSLNKLVRKGLLKPIRINQRRVRFIRASIIEYIESLK